MLGNPAPGALRDNQAHGAQSNVLFKLIYRGCVLPMLPQTWRSGLLGPCSKTLGFLDTLTMQGVLDGSIFG